MEPLHQLQDDGAQLVLSVELPAVQSAADVDLTIEPAAVHLRGQGYEWRLVLPRKVSVETSKAKFDKKRRVLKLVLPVEPAAEEKGSTELHPVAREDAPGAVRPAEEPSAHSSVSDEKIESEAPFEWRQNAQYIALIVQVPSIDSDSIERHVETRRLHVRFRSRPAGQETPQLHKLTLQLSGDVLPEASRHDAADNNMMIVLQKTTEGMWATLQDEGASEQSKQHASTKPPKNASNTKACTLDHVTEPLDPTSDISAPLENLLYELD